MAARRNGFVATPFVHEWIDEGTTRYCIGHYDPLNGVYFWPYSKKDQTRTGCLGAQSYDVDEFCGSFSYKAMRYAIPRARRIYGPSSEWGDVVRFDTPRRRKKCSSIPQTE